MRIGLRNLPKWARVVIAAVAIWDVAWKGVALWQAAKRRQPGWFAGLLVANTAGILPITYLELMRRRDAAGAAQTDEAWSAEEQVEPEGS